MFCFLSYYTLLRYVSIDVTNNHTKPKDKECKKQRNEDSKEREEKIEAKKERKQERQKLRGSKRKKEK